MSAGWARRRTWSASGVVAVAGGWGVALDGRPLATPAGAPLALPTAALAGAVAAEWAAVGAIVEPLAMPMTRAANTTIDRVARAPGEVAAEIAGWGRADLLCYRAAEPAGLVARQRAAWDPPLAWAAAALGAPLATTTGIAPVGQDASSLAALAARVAGLSPFALAALSEMVALTGSLVLGLAAEAGWEAAEDLWARSRLDEDWQAARWGRDAEAEAAAAAKRAAFLDAARFLALSRT